tara:strand:- start:139 stop:819 length:681 start_codon:yes stop_codon:yes gene_type:complete
MIPTITRTSRPIRIASLTGLALIAALASVGCSSTPKDDYAEAISENAELRDRLAETQSMLKQSEDDKEELLRQAQDLEADLRRAESARPPAGSAGGINPLGSGTTSTTYGSGDIVLSVAGDVLFSSGKVTLKAEGRRELDRIARMIMSQHPTNTIRVEGYTDTDPIRKSQWKTNERLSAERALAVEAYLVARGIESDRIYSAAMGSAKPKSNKSESRRVEIVILAN